MRTMRNLGFGLCVFMACTLSAAFAADREGRLATYQKEVQSRESGVYEVDGDLYVQVRIPASPGPAGRVKMKAVLEANELLRKWAIGYSAQARGKADAGSDGVKLAAAVADACNPAWRFNDWNVKIIGQEVSRTEKDFVLLCQIMSKDDAVKLIPPSFSQAVPQDALFKVLRPLVAAFRTRDPDRLYGMCNALDLDANAAASQKAKNEYGSVEGKIKEYLASSPLAAEFRNHSERIRAGVSSESWTEIPLNPEVEKAERVVSATNIPEKVTKTTTFVVRAQTAGEKKSMGTALRSEVKEETQVSDEEVIVETRTVTTTTIVKTVRRRTIRTSAGDPAFEEIFLSGGERRQAAAPQTENGRKAVAVYFDAITPMDGKAVCIHDALCENPGDAQLWNLYGRCLVHRKDILGALICFKVALKIDETNQYALTNLAICYDALGCTDLACGMAVLAFGAADDDWCVREARKILSGK